MNPKTALEGRVFLSGTIEKDYTWEHISSKHIIVHIYSGELTITYGRNSLNFGTGETVLVPKNQLMRVVKYPIDNRPFKAVSMLLPEEELRKFFMNRSIIENWDESVAKQRPIKSHPLLTSFFDSMVSYFDSSNNLPETLVPIKIQEVLTIIDEVDKRASTILGTFNEIGKIDLEKYMEEHFMYNLPLEKFAYLTGRSLTTFKSDFKKIFKQTPGKWLIEKRLNLAHYKLTTGKQKATDVYLSSGFENLSHFSFAFKKAFGYSPRNISSR